MVVGLFSFSMSFFAIGLAIIAIDEGVILWYTYVIFGLAGLLIVFAAVATISLVRHIAKTKGYIRQIGLYLREGYILRKELLAVDNQSGWSPELAKKMPLWEKTVQQWLERNLPDHAPDFQLETIASTTSYIIYDNVTEEAASDALHLENRLTNLREILRTIRM